MRVVMQVLDFLRGAAQSTANGPSRTVTRFTDAFKYCNDAPTSVPDLLYFADVYEDPTVGRWWQESSTVRLHLKDVFVTQCAEFTVGVLTLSWQRRDAAFGAAPPPLVVTVVGPPPPWFEFEHISFKQGDVFDVLVNWTNNAGYSTWLTTRSMTVDLHPPVARCVAM